MVLKYRRKVSTRGESPAAEQAQREENLVVAQVAARQAEDALRMLILDANSQSFWAERIGVEGGEVDAEQGVAVRPGAGAAGAVASPGSPRDRSRAVAALSSIGSRAGGAGARAGVAENFGAFGAAGPVAGIADGFSFKSAIVSGETGTNRTPCVFSCCR